MQDKRKTELMREGGMPHDLPRPTPPPPPPVLGNLPPTGRTNLAGGNEIVKDIFVSASTDPYGRSGWPGFTMEHGTAVLTASGIWLTHPHGDGGWCGPAGNGVPNHGHYPCQGPEGCLVIFYAPIVPHLGGPSQYKLDWKVWDWFRSDNQSFTADKPGHYGFAPNDDADNYQDNKDDSARRMTVHVRYHG